MSEPIVSFCTVVMNRLYHLRDTLPVNLEENKQDSIQFIVLDYNSQDGLGEYIKSNFQTQLNEGRLVYYKNNAATSFHHSHSRNMAFKLATGDIVCNLDADNYAGEGFGKYVQNIFSTRKDVCLTGLENEWKGDASGKLCISKSNFLQVTGYDENFEGYGFEDYDMVNRLQMNGCETLTINKEIFLKTISHTNIERQLNHKLWQKAESIYVHFIDQNSSLLLYLFRDGKSIYATIVNTYTTKIDEPVYTKLENQAAISHQFLVENGWQEGTWAIKDGNLFLYNNSSTEVCRRCTIGGQQSLQSDIHIYYEVTLLSMKLEAISFHSQNVNREIMINNVHSNKIQVNQAFGNGIVYKNFQEEAIKI